MMACADVDELLPGLALGIATAAERRQLEDHLATCPNHPHFAELEEVAAMLPLTSPPQPPRDQLKHRLMARVYADLEPVVLRAPWWQRAGGWLAAAVLAVVALGAGAREWFVSQQLASAPRSWALAPTGASAAHGTLVYLPQQGTATLALTQLPPLPSERVYEVWLIRGGKPEAAGTFKPAPDGSASLIVKGTPAGADVVAITEEPGPDGSPAPTTQPFIAGPLK
jgi:anti-sigma-K factor RskA